MTNTQMIESSLRASGVDYWSADHHSWSGWGIEMADEKLYKKATDAIEKIIEENDIRQVLWFINRKDEPDMPYLIFALADEYK